MNNLSKEVPRQIILRQLVSSYRVIGGGGIDRRLNTRGFLIVDSELSDNDIIQQVDTIRRKIWEKRNLV